VSATNQFERQSSADTPKNPRKINRTKNGPKISHIDPSLLSPVLVAATRLSMNLAPIDPTKNPDIPLKPNPNGYVTTPRIRTMATLGAFILRDVVMCSYCWKQGDPLQGPDGEPWGPRGGIDHVIPLCKGGIENLSNMVKCCQTCNRLKGRRHNWAPHPKAPWAAPTSTLGLLLWLNAREIYAKRLDVQPYVLEIATEEEMAALIAQWLVTQPA
jgi:hypothetical protein